MLFSQQNHVANQRSWL